MSMVVTIDYLVVPHNIPVPQQIVELIHMGHSISLTRFLILVLSKDQYFEYFIKGIDTNNEIAPVWLEAK
jgi:hypothetical protein